MTIRLPNLQDFRVFRLRCQIIRRELEKIDCSLWDRPVVFDVGANDGSTFLPFARALPWARIYAFEPTPELVAKIRSQSVGLKNYRLVPKAIGETPGTAPFNVAGTANWGCSSFLEFSDGLEVTWPDRTDFKVTQKIEVEVIRLDAFVREQKIERIDFLHVDTQGTDLAVLRSLGDEIRRVRGGVIEVPQSREVMLYRGQHTREEAEAFLDTHGFKIWKIVPAQNEDDIFYRRR